MITDVLKRTLANHIVGYLGVQGYHWNVEGPNFSEYHNLFNSVYTDYFAQVDIIGELIRTISDTTDYVNIDIDVIKLNKTIEIKLIVGNKPNDMCLSILAINEALLGDYKELVNLGTKSDDLGLVDYFTSRINEITKLTWLVKAATK